MELSSSRSEKNGYITLIGQLWQKDELATVEEAVENLIQDGIKTVVVDVDRLSFINSQGLGLLVRLHGRLSELGGKTILLNPRSSVLEVIEISGFDLFMSIAHSNDELQNMLKS
jgi:anti-sigma B factor antagonist